MKAIIIEDEELSAKHLGYLLKKIDPEISIIATFDSVKSSIKAFTDGLQADLLFVDIHLADGLSFEIFAKTTVDIPVIFTTAYDTYAIKAFKQNSIDYLLKPIGIEELKSALLKFNRQHTNQSMFDKVTSLYQQMNRQSKNRFMVKSGDAISTIKTEDIAHFISEDGMVLLVTNNAKRFIIDYTLDALENQVSSVAFFRINRKVIINIESIQKVSPYFNSRLKLITTHLSDEDSIVSRERVSEFKLWLDR